MSGVVILGGINMDLVLRTPRLPAPGETIIGHGFLTAPGGKGSNQAVAAARLGVPAALIGRVGADDFGRALRRSLTDAGVDTRFVTEDPEAATGIASIWVEDGGQNSIVAALGANLRVTRAEIDAAAQAIQTASVFVAQLEVPLDAVQYALQIAHAAGVTTLLNPAPACPLPSEVLALTDALLPNETEAALLTGVAVRSTADAETAARLLRGVGARRVIVTLGEGGALWLEGETARHIHPFKVQAVDTTAAGDAFVGALAAALAQGKSWTAGLREASAAGALAATKMGAQPSLPTRAELDAFLAAHPA